MGLLLKECRIIFSNEIKAEVKLNGNFIKKLSSGGDELSTRKMYQEETTFVPHFLSCVMSNDLNTITPYDDGVNNRVRVINYPKVFVEGEPQNELELKMDPFLNDEINTPEFKKCFVMLNIKRYVEFVHVENEIEIEPEEVKQAKEVWVGTKDETDYVCRFLMDYEMTGEKEDYIESSKIIEWINVHNIGITMTKMGMELNNYCKKKKK